MELRPAEPSDALDVARVHVRSWQAAYRGLLPADFLASLDPQRRARSYTFGEDSADSPFTVLAVRDGRPCGFATTGPARPPGQAGVGELYAIYVDPDDWGSGAGRVLIGAARDRLGRLGFTEAVLWVLEGNARAERFYRADGWAPDGGRRVERLGGAWQESGRVADPVVLPELRYRRPL